MIHSLFGSQDQNKDSNIQCSNNNLKNMRKGVMINGSEVYYGNGRKPDIQTSNININRRKIEKSNKIKATNYSNQIKHNNQISYTYNKKDYINSNTSGGYKKTLVKEEKIKKLSTNKEMEFIIDETKPKCFINIRLFKGDLIKGEFNCDQTLGKVYSFVKKFSHNSYFTLLGGYPPSPLMEYEKTISELGLENSVLTQRIN